MFGHRMLNNNKLFRYSFINSSYKYMYYNNIPRLLIILFLNVLKNYYTQLVVVIISSGIFDRLKTNYIGILCTKPSK